VELNDADIALIDRYFDGTLTDVEKGNFAQRMGMDAFFNVAVEQHVKMRTGINNRGKAVLKASMTQISNEISPKELKRYRKGPSAGFIFVIAIIVFAASVITAAFIYSLMDEDVESTGVVEEIESKDCMMYDIGDPSQAWGGQDESVAHVLGADSFSESNSSQEEYVEEDQGMQQEGTTYELTEEMLGLDEVEKAKPSMLEVCWVTSEKFKLHYSIDTENDVLLMYANKSEDFSVLYITPLNGMIGIRYRTEDYHLDHFNEIVPLLTKEESIGNDLPSVEADSVLHEQPKPLPISPVIEKDEATQKVNNLQVKGEVLTQPSGSSNNHATESTIISDSESEEVDIIQ